MNLVVLAGRLTKDPEIRWTQSSQPLAIARYSLAVDRRVKKEGEPSADFLNCVAFGKNAEFAEKYMTKGRKFLVEGRIQTGSYTKDDGTKVYTTDIIVERQEFADGKPDGQATAAVQAAEPANDGFTDVPPGIEEELPFH